MATYSTDSVNCVLWGTLLLKMITRLSATEVLPKFILFQGLASLASVHARETLSKADA